MYWLRLVPWVEGRAGVRGGALGGSRGATRRRGPAPDEHTDTTTDDGSAAQLSSSSPATSRVALISRSRDKIESSFELEESESRELMSASASESPLGT